MHYLPEYLLQISDERGSGQTLSFTEISEGFRKVAKEVDGFLSELSIQAGSFGFHDRLLQNQSIEFNLNMLESSLLEFSRLAKPLTYTLTLLFEIIIWQIRSLTLIKIRDL